jgi:hypothetical protein
MKKFKVKPYQRPDGPEMFAVYTREGKLIAECSTKEAADDLALTLNISVVRRSLPAG